MTCKGGVDLFSLDKSCLVIKQERMQQHTFVFVGDRMKDGCNRRF